MLAEAAAQRKQPEAFFRKVGATHFLRHLEALGIADARLQRLAAQVEALAAATG